MAGALNLVRLAGLALLCLGSASLRAQSLADPTRPPAALAPAASAATAGPAASAPPTREPALQALRLGPDLAPSALVDGRLLRVGDRLGALRVQAIAAEGVLLQKPEGGSQWLRLNPAVRKSAAAVQPARLPTAQPSRPAKENP